MRALRIAPTTSAHATSVTTTPSVTVTPIAFSTGTDDVASAPNAHSVVALTIASDVGRRVGDATRPSRATRTACS